MYLKLRLRNKYNIIQQMRRYAKRHAQRFSTNGENRPRKTLNIMSATSAILAIFPCHHLLQRTPLTGVAKLKAHPTPPLGQF
jgi:hypothetical protein